MAESTRLKLFQKLIKTYTESHKENHAKDVLLELSGVWTKINKLKDSDLEVTVSKKI